MKIYADDQEPIGLSAIDLFASGMGAFILIAIIFMILFAATSMRVVPTQICPEPTETECPAVEACPPPVTCPVPNPTTCPVCPVVEAPVCPQCPTVAEVDTPTCPPIPEPDCPTVVECPICAVCEEPTPAEPVPQPTPISCPEPTESASILPETDIVFVLDTTNSMVFEIESLKRELYVVVDVLERMMPSVGIGVVTFKDRYQRPTIRHHRLKEITNNANNLNDLQRFLRTISIHNASGNNPDMPEAIFVALQQAVTTSFRPHIENRVVIVITDSFAYPEEQNATYNLAAAFAQTEGQRVSAVFVRSYPDTEQYLKNLAEAGGGMLVHDRGSILANVLLGLIEES